MAYRKSLWLKAYLIVDQQRCRVERYWRGEGRFSVPCPEAELTLDGICEGL